MAILNKERLRANLDEVIWNIEQARITVSEHHIVKLVTVAKYTELENIATLYELGQRAFGENQVQQLKERMELLDALPLEWHMIGSLQKNKINNLIDLRPSLLQSLDGLELAMELNKKLVAKETTLSCLLQINAAQEESKSGVAPDEAIDIYQRIKESCPQISLRGVMTIGAHTEERKMIQHSFERTHDIYESLQKEGASICSMGMSSDYQLAIKCGSNLVRVGSALFK
ncbi:MAG TPA: YggS family pyridoxal phosphate-dependent enzyme [Sulfurovum sp.]|nr:MAG: YggS family pyridoxal phosphate enzyme [Sulfurovum sp. 16-42-52]HQR74767.1 YggS family pyridoxal phosphate-dependent enzyme [Sulfurovum sp.]HQS71926.1 YggS family pyridoxal phosphate-dependent enzyme [Sulfurovum sp.]HQT28238.1 YggS family pyridoxal phosphate-dependent enzyme [Sulfurovum sp.]